jgi:hypothetical protein
VNENNVMTQDGASRATLLWKFFRDTLASKPSATPWGGRTDGEIYRRVLKPVFTAVAYHADLCDLIEHQVEVVGEDGEKSYETRVQVSNAKGPMWEMIFAVRGPTMRPSAQEVEAAVRKAFPDLAAAAAPPAEVRNVVVAPAAYVERSQENAPRLEARPVLRLGASQKFARWREEYAETIATGDKERDDILLKPLLLQPNDEARRRAMERIRHGREQVAEEKRLRDEERVEKRGGEGERLSEFRSASAEIQQLHARKREREAAEAKAQVAA